MRKLIGISGKMGSGKNTVASMLCDIDQEFEQKSYGHKLKQVCSILTGIPIEKFEDQEFKKTQLGIEWWPDFRSMSVRELLQKVGTECMRDCLHPNTWVNALFADYKENSKWIITDVRFPNEYKAIKEFGGVVVRVSRPCISYDEHISETVLDNHKFDYKIYNEGDFNALYDQVKELYEKIIV